jgi:hypothetical protein
MNSAHSTPSRRRRAKKNKKGGYSVNAIPYFPLHPCGSHGCSSPTSTTRNDLPVLPTLLQNTELRAHGTSTSHQPNIYSEQFHYSNWGVPVLFPLPIDCMQNEECAAGAACTAPQGRADLFGCTHRCWGCEGRVHSSILCGMSLDNLLSVHPRLIGCHLPNSNLMAENSDNEMRCICHSCISNVLAAQMQATKPVIQQPVDNHIHDDNAKAEQEWLQTTGISVQQVYRRATTVDSRTMSITLQLPE